MKTVILGGTGLIGGSIQRILSDETSLITPSRSEIDLTNSEFLLNYLRSVNPDLVINAAGAVAGIQGNIDHPAELLLQNVEITVNVINVCAKLRIPNYIQFASACVYPIQENRPSTLADLGNGPIEKTSESYAYSKILAIEAVKAVRKQYRLNWTTLIPSNIYGPNDWNHGSGGHLISMLTSRFIDAKKANLSEVEVWGDGKSRRNLLHVDDLALAVNFLLKASTSWDAIYNVCGNEEFTIREIADIIKTKTAYSGKIEFDSRRPNGARRKILDDTAIRSIGWKPIIGLESGIENYILKFKDSFK